MPPRSAHSSEEGTVMSEQWNKYSATAARRHGKPGRELRPNSINIDVHSHVAVPAAAEFVEPYLDWATIPLAHFADAATKALSQKQEADVRSRSGHEQRLSDLDAMGIDVQIIAPPPPQCYYTVPLDIAVKATRIVNDGIAEFCATHPERFKGFGAVPMTDGVEAAKELERCRKQLGF
ncbi:MAG: amidohydrolase family protein, partial [Acidobacteria bacterium Pan2503]|nr:amidohydrolase family protein [Candidatus Acidoferrum panamensis]